MSILEIQNKISPIFREFGIKKAAIFGSVARGDDKPNSDVDILISLGDRTMSLLDFILMTNKAEKTLGRKIDMVTEDSLNKFIKPYIIKDLKVIYEG